VRTDKPCLFDIRGIRGEECLELFPETVTGILVTVWKELKLLTTNYEVIDIILIPL
jgi:hypothetical protein